MQGRAELHLNFSSEAGMTLIFAVSPTENGCLTIGLLEIYE